MDRNPRFDGVMPQDAPEDRDEASNPYSGVVLEGELVFEKPPRRPWIGIATLVHLSLAMFPLAVGVFLAPFTFMASLPLGLVFSLTAAIALFPFYLMFVLGVIAWRMLFGRRSGSMHDEEIAWGAQETWTYDESPPASRHVGPLP